MTGWRVWAHSAFFGVGLILSSRPAAAHLVQTGLGPVYDGVAHFVVSPEYLAPIVGAALYAGFGGKAPARRAIVMLPLFWFAGSLLGELPRAPPLILPTWLVLIGIGAFVAADLPLPAALRIALCSMVGIALGYSNGLIAAGAADPLRSALGATAAVFIVTSLASAAAAATSGWIRIVFRVLGSWIAASGLLALGWALH